MQPHVVVLEDDSELRGLLVAGLREEGFDVIGALPPSRPARKKPDRKQKATEELKQARERVRELEKEAKAAEREAERLKAERKKSERAAESARVAVAAAERDLTQAQRRARK